MKKKGIAVLLVLAVALSFTGCFRLQAHLWDSDVVNKENQFGAQYHQLNGIRRRVIEVSGPTDLYGMVETEHGELEITVTDDSGKVCYERKKIPSTTLVIPLEQAGTYVITVCGSGHVGRFQFDWDAGGDEPFSSGTGEERG